MIAREEARLRALFRRLVLLSVATSPLACSSSGSAGGTDASTSTDATTANSPDGAPASDDAGLDATTTGSGDATTAGAPDGSDDAGDPYGYADSACDPIVLDAQTEGGCDFFETLPCGLPPDAATEGCYLSLVQCGIMCNQQVTLKRVCAITECLNVDASSIPSTTPITLECATGLAACSPGVGRRPEGLEEASRARGGDGVGAVLAEQAWLEAASVHAFRRLGAELTSMRAPRSLVRAAERSARDEVRHARVMTRLARRHGAAPARVVVKSGEGERSLEAFAIENAVEGCVRECFGALVATRQASCAVDPDLAREMGRIALDETRHAALSRSIARWVEPRLSAAARARVRAATEAALGALRCEVESTSGEVARALGLPTGREATALMDAFEAELFATDERKPS